MNKNCSTQKKLNLFLFFIVAHHSVIMQNPVIQVNNNNKNAKKKTLLDKKKVKLDIKVISRLSMLLLFFIAYSLFNALRWW